MSIKTNTQENPILSYPIPARVYGSHQELLIVFAVLSWLKTQPGVSSKTRTQGVCNLKKFFKDSLILYLITARRPPTTTNTKAKNGDARRDM